MYYFIIHNKIAILIKDNNGIKDIKVRHFSGNL